MPQETGTDDQQAESGHEVSIEGRERALITGVLQVISFDEEEIVLDTELGVLKMQGEGLDMKEMSLSQGIFSVEGLIVVLEYEKKTRREGIGEERGFWERLLR